MFMPLFHTLNNLLTTWHKRVPAAPIEGGTSNPDKASTLPGVIEHTNPLTKT